MNRISTLRQLSATGTRSTAVTDVRRANRPPISPVERYRKEYDTSVERSRERRSAGAGWSGWPPPCDDMSGPPFAAGPKAILDARADWIFLARLRRAVGNAFFDPSV